MRPSNRRMTVAMTHSVHTAFEGHRGTESQNRYEISFRLTASLKTIRVRPTVPVQALPSAHVLAKGT
jgi:hypothetical protein